MANRSKTGKGKGSANPWVAAVIFAVMAVSVLWWWSPSPVELDQDAYEVVVALYSACNQHNEEGLAKIEDHLLDSDSSQTIAKASHDAIAGIITDARAGDWNAATKACRQLLEDQVQR